MRFCQAFEQAHVAFELRRWLAKQIGEARFLLTTSALTPPCPRRVFDPTDHCGIFDSNRIPDPAVAENTNAITDGFKGAKNPTPFQ